MTSYENKPRQLFTQICPICAGDHSARFHQSSNGYKFGADVRQEARDLAENVCAICGKRESYDVHHLLAIWAYKLIQAEPELSEGLVGLNKQVLTSAYNALVVCDDCHTDLHYLDEESIGDEAKQAKRLEFYHWMAKNILALYYGQDQA